MQQQEIEVLVQNYLDSPEDEIFASMGMIVADYAPAAAKAYSTAHFELALALQTSPGPPSDPRKSLGRVFWHSLATEIQKSFCPDKDKYKSMASPAVLIPIIMAILSRILPPDWAGALSYLTAQAVALIFRAGVETFCSIQFA